MKLNNDCNDDKNEIIINEFFQNDWIIILQYQLNICLLYVFVKCIYVYI